LERDNASQMHIGIDDTDSTRQGCTTYVAALLIEKLEMLGATFTDYPTLIRLNPNIPWKTRGNGALCLRVKYDEASAPKIKEETLKLVEEHSDLQWKGTDPGIVFFPGANVPSEVTAFSKVAETGIVNVSQALRLIRKFHAEAIGYNKQRGIIGALSAIGETLRGDYTYEIISYRKPENFGKKRRVEVTSIFEMDKKLQPLTFNNVDTEKHRVIITPRGPDPVLFGIRGESPQVVKKALEMVRPIEPVDRWVIFRSNQGTDAHLKRISTLSEAKPYGNIIANGMVSRTPKIIPVRHVVFAIKDEISEIDCAAYEPTGTLRKIAQQLEVGDQIEVYGAVRKPSANMPLTVNLEKIKVLQLKPKTHPQNPLCTTCGKRLKSMGKNQGFRCENCKTKYPRARKGEQIVERTLKTGLYITSSRSQRHLTKPLRRYGLEWHSTV
jgi:tRNA(Ile2)-agmatinylcytidine synthase